MPLVQCDILIKELRKQKGITQQELANGICAKDSLSRIERGLRRPDWHTFQQLMQRLGEDPHKYYNDIITMNDKRIMDLKDRLTVLLREKKNDEAEAVIKELESDEDFREGVNYQFLLRIKATLANNRKDYEGTYKYAIDALKITMPDFDEDKIDTYVLTFDEIMLIKLISVAYSFLTGIEKSTYILLKLKNSVDKGYSDEKEKAKTYLSILYNTSKNLGLLKRYEESINISEQGIEYSLTNRDSHFYPLFLYNKAFCMLYLGERGEGEEILRKAIDLFKCYERNAELSIIKNTIIEEFGIVIED